MEVWPASVTVAGGGLTGASRWWSLESNRAGHILRPVSVDKSGARTLVLLGDSILLWFWGAPEYFDALGQGRRKRSKKPATFPLGGNQPGFFLSGLPLARRGSSASPAHVLLLPSTTATRPIGFTQWQGLRPGHCPTGLPCHGEAGRKREVIG